MKRARALWPAIGVLALACSVETSVTAGPIDAGALDARARGDAGYPRLDAGERADSGTRRDTGPVDAPTPSDDGGLGEDSGTADAGEPDAGRRLRCDELYGATNGYYLCEERDDECMFYAYLDRATCDEVCGEGAIPGTCTGNEGNLGSSGAERCVPTGSGFMCSVGYTDHICICSRP